MALRILLTSLLIAFSASALAATEVVPLNYRRSPSRLSALTERSVRMATS